MKRSEGQNAISMSSKTADLPSNLVGILPIEIVVSGNFTYNCRIRSRKASYDVRECKRYYITNQELFLLKRTDRSYF